MVVSFCSCALQEEYPAEWSTGCFLALMFIVVGLFFGWAFTSGGENMEGIYDNKGRAIAYYGTGEYSETDYNLRSSIFGLVFILSIVCFAACLIDNEVVTYWMLGVCGALYIILGLYWYFSRDFNLPTPLAKFLAKIPKVIRIIWWIIVLAVNIIA